MIHVEEGQLLYRVTDERRTRYEALLTPDSPPGIVEPTIMHRVEPQGPVRFHVEFLQAPLLEGEGQVRALICNGSTMSAWPDQRKTQAAMAKLDLLVTLDVNMSLTSRLADYVIATKMTLEAPGMTQRVEALKYYTIGIGLGEPYAQYSPRIVDPPKGSQLIEEWQAFHGLARRLGHDLTLGSYFGFGQFMEAPPVVFTIKPDDNPTTEELYEKMCATSHIPIAEVRKHPHGKIFNVEEYVQEKDAERAERLDVGNVHMIAELAKIGADNRTADADDPLYSFRLIPRRANNFVNSSGLKVEKLNRGKFYNTLYMHPNDIADLGLEEVDPITITSRHDFIPSIVEARA